MTFIIGRVIQGGIRIDSDSKVTDYKIASNRNTILSSVLKSLILTPQISVAYAGGEIYAEKAIEELYGLKTFGFSDVKNILLRTNIDSINDKHVKESTDFLIGILEADPMLFKITGGNCEPATCHWIGDQQGFSLFQQKFLPRLKSTDPRHVFSMQGEAFDEVLTNQKLDNIGGFRITVHRGQNGLEYLVQSQATIGRPITVTSNFANMTPVPVFGNAARGDHSYCYLKSDNPWEPAIAIYFPYGRFGVFYYPKKSREKILITEVEPLNFIEEVRNKFGIKLTGMLKVGNGFRHI